MAPRLQQDNGSDGIDEAEVLQCLEQALASPVFAKVERPSRYLRYVVESVLRGRGAELKESVLGVAVFGRPATWDPRLDPVVRQEAQRLRKRLARYYETDGASAAIRIELPVGGYVPVFRRAEAAIGVPEEAAPSPSPGSRWPWRFRFLLASAGVVVLAALFTWRLAPRGGGLRPGQSDAEQLYLRGRYLWNKRTPESLNQAVHAFTQAVVRDSKYAPAYVGLADCYNLLREFATMPAEEAYPRARAAARRALELDDALAEAHGSLAFVEFWWNWNGALAEHEFQRAIQINPNYATAHHWYATFLYELGRFDEAEQQIMAAQKLEPASTAIVADKAAINFFQGRQTEALAAVKQLTELETGFSAGHRYLSAMYLTMEDYPRYLSESQIASRLRGDPLGASLAVAGRRGLQRAGTRGMFTELLREKEKLYREGRMQAFDLASAYGWLGDNQRALEYLEISFQKRESQFPDVYSFRPFRDSSAFDEIKSRFRRLMQTGLGR